MHNSVPETKNRTLVLRSIEEGANLCYLVEFEFDGNTRVFFKGENYNQAIFIAEQVDTWLRQHLDSYFDFMLEEAQGQGMSYLNSAYDRFPEATDESAEFYNELCDEFETRKISEIHDLNALFRKMVNKNKLNQYQEHRFLEELKKRDQV